MFGCCQSFRERLLEIPPKHVFREPNSAEEEKAYLDSRVPKSTAAVCHKMGLKNIWRVAKFKRNKEANFDERVKVNNV